MFSMKLNRGNTYTLAAKTRVRISEIIYRQNSDRKASDSQIPITTKTGRKIIIDVPCKR